MCWILYLLGPLFSQRWSVWGFFSPTPVRRLGGAAKEAMILPQPGPVNTLLNPAYYAEQFPAHAVSFGQWRQLGFFLKRRTPWTNIAPDRFSTQFTFSNHNWFPHTLSHGNTMFSFPPGEPGTAGRGKKHGRRNHALVACFGIEIESVPSASESYHLKIWTWNSSDVPSDWLPPMHDWVSQRITPHWQ